MDKPNTVESGKKRLTTAMSLSYALYLGSSCADNQMSESLFFLERGGQTCAREERISFEAIDSRGYSFLIGLGKS